MGQSHQGGSHYTMWLLSVGPHLHGSLLPSVLIIHSMLFCVLEEAILWLFGGLPKSWSCWSGNEIGHGENFDLENQGKIRCKNTEHVLTFVTEQTLGLESENRGMVTTSNACQPRELQWSIPNHSFLPGDIIPVLLCLPHFALMRSNGVFMEIVLINLCRFWNCEVVIFQHPA